MPLIAKTTGVAGNRNHYRTIRAPGNHARGVVVVVLPDQSQHYAIFLGSLDANGSTAQKVEKLSNQ